MPSVIYAPQAIALLKMVFWFGVIPLYMALFAYSLGLIFGWTEKRDYEKRQHERKLRNASTRMIDFQKKKIAKLINAALKVDGMFTIEEEYLFKAFDADQNMPTEEEVVPFVMGGDDGQIPKELVAKYIHLHKLINMYY